MTSRLPCSCTLLSFIVVSISLLACSNNPPTQNSNTSSGPPPTPDTASKALLENGYHDTSSCERITGWAWDKNQPNTPIKVDIYDGKTLLAKVTADQFRQDLLDIGIGNGNHGFVYAVPASLSDGRPHAILVKISGTDMVLSKLQNTAKSITCQPQ